MVREGVVKAPVIVVNAEAVSAIANELAFVDLSSQTPYHIIVIGDFFAYLRMHIDRFRDLSD